MKDNTVGSQSTSVNHAYIAGFLDGDGSIMLQIKKRHDTKRGIRFMATICFYQDSRHEKPLHWIRKMLGIGYIHHRNDGMTEVRINGFKQVQDVLEKMLPHLKFKREQATSVHRACQLLAYKRSADLNVSEKRMLCRLMLCV